LRSVAAGNPDRKEFYDRVVNDAGNNKNRQVRATHPARVSLKELYNERHSLGEIADSGDSARDEVFSSRSDHFQTWPPGIYSKEEDVKTAAAILKQPPPLPPPR